MNAFSHRHRNGRAAAPCPAHPALASVLALAWFVCHAAPGHAQPIPPETLKRLTIEELMGVEVTTVLRVPESTTTVPAAVFVITQDDIRRSGALSLTEVLRLVPGLQVARIDSARYAIGIRGFADRLARSMLVLIDGRAVYSPLFAGTYWEVQDTLLEDIDRIEVIRGPGGTLWGANAVNGIINIITKRAADTQGAFVTATLGSDSRGPIGVRYGGSAGSSLHFRTYAKGFDRSAQVHLDDADYDDWRLLQAGFRADWAASSSQSLTVQGDAYAAELGQPVNTAMPTPPFNHLSTRRSPLSGGNLLARWSGSLWAGQYQLQTFYDRTRRDERPVAETRNTFDVDFQHQRRAGERHNLVWGVGYRVSRGRIDAVAPTAFTPSERTDPLYTAFVHDDIAVASGRLRFMLGTKLEHNAYTGFEVQPSGRIMWNVNNSNALFAAVTRAVRTSSRVETDYTTTALANPTVPAYVRLLPNPDFESEKLTAYELGYRVRPDPSVYVTISGFFNHLDDTLSTELSRAFVETAPPPARLILPVTFRNGLHGNSHGVEVTGDYRPVTWWRSALNYSLLRVQMTPDPGSADVSQERRYEGLAPTHQVQLQSSVDLPRSVSVDWLLRYISELPAGPVPAYATSTVRVAWRPSARLELALIGQDLHDERHLEWADGEDDYVQIRRRVYVNFTWRH